MPEKAVFKPVVPFILPRWATNPPATQNTLKTAKNGPGGFCVFSRSSLGVHPLPGATLFVCTKVQLAWQKKDAAILTSFFLTFGCASCGFGAAFFLCFPFVKCPEIVFAA